MNDKLYMEEKFLPTQTLILSHLLDMYCQSTLVMLAQFKVKNWDTDTYTYYNS